LRNLAANRHGHLPGAKAGNQGVDPGFGPVVGRGEVNVLIQGDMGYRLDCPRQVIEHEQRVGEHPGAVRKVEAASQCRRDARLKRADRLVGEIPDSAACEPRQRKIRHFRSPARGNKIRERLERIVV
jgi:hypothetical protein